MSASVGKARHDSYDEDFRFLDRFLAGDPSAFEEIYKRYYDKVYVIAKGILLDADEAADAVQEIFTLVSRNLPRFDRRSRFSTWLYRVAVNRSIQQARRLKYKNRMVPLNEALGKEAPDDGSGNVDPKVHTALAKMHPADRAIITLFYWDDLSLHEIAESMSCSVNAAKTRLYRARERFRGIYEAETA